MSWLSMANFYDIPNELLLLIASFCNQGTLYSLSLACRRSKIVFSIGFNELHQGDARRVRLFLRSILEQPALQDRVRITTFDFLGPVEEDDENVLNKLVEDDTDREHVEKKEENNEGSENEELRSEEDRHEDVHPAVVRRNSIPKETKADLKILLLAAEKVGMDSKWNERSKETAISPWPSCSPQHLPVALRNISCHSRL